MGIRRQIFAKSKEVVPLRYTLKRRSDLCFEN
jgi:hypothetical protein